MVKEKDTQSLVNKYFFAKHSVMSHGYNWEINWQSERCFEFVQESEFLCESAWTILVSGFRETIIRKLFDSISVAFLQWQSANLINKNRNECKISAMNIFHNEKKSKPF